jgi:hypothetical protein
MMIMHRIYKIKLVALIIAFLIINISLAGSSGLPNISSAIKISSNATSNNQFGPNKSNSTETTIASPNNNAIYMKIGLDLDELTSYNNKDINVKIKNHI